MSQKYSQGVLPKRNVFLKVLLVAVVMVSLLAAFGFLWFDRAVIFKNFYDVDVLPEQTSESGIGGSATDGGEAPDEKAVFVIYGDSRSNVEVHSQIVAKIMELSPDAVFHTGDLVADGNNPQEWVEFETAASELVATGTFYPALGNHEKEAQRYFDEFTLPNNERWYSVDFSAAHFVVLDSNVDLNPDSEQYNWLVQDLSSQPLNGFVAVVFHQPVFSSGPHGGSPVLQASLVPLFDRYGVDMVFNGHDHDYERLENNGILYIVAGGGGAPLYDAGVTDQRSKIFMKEYSYCTLEEVGNRFILTAFGIQGNLLDQVEIWINGA